jgi:AICAR transformylase/IMP cyclohydrolase PurH
MFFQALLSVYDKTDLFKLDLAKGLADAGVRLLGSGLQRK